MRTWGLIVCFTAGAAVWLGQTATMLAVLLVSAVMIAALVAVLCDYADRRVQRELDQASRPIAAVGRVPAQRGPGVQS